MAPIAYAPVADRVVERRRAVALARHYREAEASRSGRSPTASVARRRQLRRTSTIRPATRRVRSRPATSVCPAAAARTPSRGTGRATRTRTARRATRARSSGAGLPNGCSPRCASGAPATGGCPRPMTGHARTRNGAGETRSSGSREESGHQRASLPPLFGGLRRISGRPVSGPLFDSRRPRPRNHPIRVRVAAQTTLPARGLAVMDGIRWQPRGTRAPTRLMRTSARLPGRHL